MELDFNKIIRLRRIRKEQTELCKEENRLTTPLLTDRGMIGDIYKIFVDVLGERDCPPQPDSVIQRKKFIFIILYLYSPSALAGRKMLGGLREDLSKVLGIQAQTTISDNCADVVFLYQNYSDFCRDVECLYAEIVNRLRDRGVLE